MGKTDTSKKNKHLTAEDRKEIEDCLRRQMTFKDIAQLIQKDPSTISYEIKHHRCEHRNSFTTEDGTCPNLLKAPFVCNGCQKRSSASCHFPHFYYRATPAQSEYKALLTNAREGTPLNKQEFYETDRIISEGLRKGQHIYHIMASSPEITCSKSTVYHHFQKGYYSASVIDLPRAVKFKARKSHKDDYVPSDLKLGRSYDDFLDDIAKRDLQCHMELDTMIGRIGGRVIMTVHFTSCNFMAGLLMDNKSSAEGAARFSSLKSRLRRAGISIPALFGVLLCDNGGEFADVFSFGNDDHGTQELSMFFCDPMRSSQKPRIEKITRFSEILSLKDLHSMISHRIPSNLIFSHVNSVSRAIYAGRTPFELFSFLYGERTAALMGISRIDPKQVVQSPALLKGLADLNRNL